jgi:hypothetical protein
MTLTVRLDPELERELEIYCQETRLTKSEVVTRLLRDYLAAAARGKSSYELARQAGLIGCDDTGPEDAGANAKRYVRESVRAKHSR